MSRQLGENEFRRVLLIDDEPGIRRMLGMDLEADGFQVSTAADGREGLARFESEKPDIVITDLKMPVMDGMAVLKAVKASGEPTEVVVITGHGDLDLAIKALQLAASDFVTKPINDAALAVALARARERLALKAELAAHTAGLEDKVREATSRLLGAERMAAVGQTVASLGHTLKNMLVGLNAASYMLGKEAKANPGGQLAQGVEMLDRNLSRVKRLVKDLLHLASAHQPDLLPLDASELAAEAAKHCRAKADEARVGLRLTAPGEAMPLLGDQASLLDALVNLLCNAIEAVAEVPQGAVELSLVREDGRALFRVTDNGPGLSPEARQKIFQGFYTGKGTGGTGLGLMISRKTAELHGGRLWCQDNSGGGASFILALPLAGQEPVG